MTEYMHKNRDNIEFLLNPNKCILAQIQLHLNWVASNTNTTLQHRCPYQLKWEIIF